MISIKQAYEAYRKLKNYFYFDNTSLFIRHQIAEFEREFYPSSGKVDVKAIFEKKLDGILKVLNDNDDQVLNLYLSQIGFRYICKSVVPDKSESKFIINRPLNNDVLVDKMNMIIQAPVEIHVISVLWLMLVGVHFSTTIGKSNYAYQFMLNEDEDDIKHSGLQLYRPYYIGYQEWRDKALSTALRLLDEKKAARSIDKEFRRESIWIPIAGYAAATAIGIERVASDRNHWYDVVAGAAVGFGSAELTWWLSDKLFGKGSNVAVGTSGNTVDVVYNF